jgi:hypothetical protein
MMLISILHRQLSLPNATHATQNEHSTVDRVGLRLENLLHRQQVLLSANEEPFANVRSVEKVQTFFMT